jgi:hypothetical protein
MAERGSVFSVMVVTLEISSTFAGKWIQIEGRQIDCVSDGMMDCVTV